MEDISCYIEKEQTLLLEAMRRINLMLKHILFLVDEKKHLVGTLTDGDIRRYLLSGGHIEDKCILAANRNPIIAHNITQAIRILEKKYIAIPILDSEGRIIDIYEGEKHKKEYGRINIPVVINAGGRGTRLDPFTRVLPKPLIPIGELPIIELIMQEYKKYECSKFHIIINYKKDLMKAYFRECENKYDITWYDEKKPLGTGGGLTLLRGCLQDTFIFSNCDALLTADYESIVRFHRENENLITMVCAYKEITIPYGVIEMGVNGKIKEMREKPRITVLANTGIYIVEPQVIDEMNDGEEVGFPDIIRRIDKSGGKVAGFPVGENEWMDMGQLPELEKMRIRINEELIKGDNYENA